LTEVKVGTAPILAAAKQTARRPTSRPVRIDGLQGDCTRSNLDDQR
jgi:hypothetical protein